MSNRRTSFGQRVAQDVPRTSGGRGAGAFLPEDAPAPAPAPPLPTAGNPASSAEAETWDANHKRVTCYCPLDLLHELEEAVHTTGRSKSQFLVEGLRLALDRDGGKR